MQGTGLTGSSECVPLSRDTFLESTSRPLPSTPLHLTLTTSSLSQSLLSQASLCRPLLSPSFYRTFTASSRIPCPSHCQGILWSSERISTPPFTSFSSHLHSKLPDFPAPATAKENLSSKHVSSPLFTQLLSHLHSKLADLLVPVIPKEHLLEQDPVDLVLLLQSLLLRL